MPNHKLPIFMAWIAAVSLQTSCSKGDPKANEKTQAAQAPASGAEDADASAADALDLTKKKAKPTPKPLPFCSKTIKKNCRPKVVVVAPPPPASPQPPAPPASRLDAQICAGVTADISGNYPAATALQTCIDNTASGGTLEIPWGIYQIEHQIGFNRPITFRTAGSAGQAGCFETVDGSRLGQRNESVPCAMFVAGVYQWDIGGMLVMRGSDVHIDHVFLNGNRAARINDEKRAACQSNLPERGAGANAGVSDCSRCSFTAGGSIAAVCGSGFAWGGTNSGFANFSYNYVAQNGDRAMVSDGFTGGIMSDGEVAYNYMADNSDVQLILFGGPRVKVHNNSIRNVGSMASFAGLMLDNMGVGTGDLGNYDGADISYNAVNCSVGTPDNYYGCDFGLMVGGYAWYSMDNGQWIPPIHGGNIHHNWIVHAKQGVLMAGAGTQASPTNLDATNVVQSTSPGSASGFGNATSRANTADPTVGCANGVHATADFWADGGTVVNYAPNQPHWTIARWEGCM